VWPTGFSSESGREGGRPRDRAPLAAGSQRSRFRRSSSRKWPLCRRSPEVSTASIRAVWPHRAGRLMGVVRPPRRARYAVRHGSGWGQLVKPHRLAYLICCQPAVEESALVTPRLISAGRSRRSRYQRTAWMIKLRPNSLSRAAQGAPNRSRRATHCDGTLNPRDDAGGPASAVPLVLVPVDALHEGRKSSVEHGKSSRPACGN
jgi:hypothetical protein